jgi:hypothetical protein
MKNFFIKFGTILLIIGMNLIIPLSASALLPVQVNQGGTGVNTITGIPFGTGTAPLSVVTIGSGLSFSGGTLSATNAGTVTSVSGTTNRITSTGGATPVIDISGNYVGQSSITTLGTIGTGVWNGTSIGTGFTDAKVVSVSCTTITCSGTNPASFSVADGAITNAKLANSTISGISLGSNLNNLTATDSTLTFSGSYNGSTARTVGLNLTQSNTWTGQQIFNTTAPKLGTITGSTQCLHVDTTGLISGTGSECGTSSSSGTVTSVDTTSASNGITATWTNTTTTPRLTIAQASATPNTLVASDATTPHVDTTSGSTNTGYFLVNGKTSGALKITAADATAQTVTLTTAAQTTGAAILTIPDMAHVNKTIAWLESPVFTTPNIGSATGSVSGNAGTATALQNARTLWGQSFDGTGNISGNLTAVGNITGGASSMTITAGTGNSRTLALQSTTSGGTATTFLTGDASQNTTLAGNLTLGASTSTITGAAGNMTIVAGTGNSRTLALQSTTSGGTATTFLTGNADQSTTFGGNVNVSAFNVVTDTTTGTKIGTATNQKLAFYNSAPIVQPSGNALTALSNLGLISSPTLTATNVGLGNVTNDAQIKASIGTTKGDLITFSGSATPVRLGAGASAGNLRTDGSGNWTIDTATYLTGNQSITLSGDVTGSGATAITTTVAKIAGTTVSGTTGSTNVVFSGTPTIATPVINGLATGTGVASGATASTLVVRDSNANITANNWLGGYTTTVTSSTPITLTVGSTYLQYLTGSTAQTVNLPVVSTLVLGTQFVVVNNSSAVTTVKSSGANTVQAMVASSYATFTSIATTGTDQTVWSVSYSPAATSANTASTLVLRDGSGNFSAGTITAALTGNASTATKSTNLIGGNSTTLLGSVPYQSNTDTTSFVVNTTTTKKFLTETGDGTNGAAPGWNTISAGDVPTLNQNTTGTANIAGGTAGAIPYQSSANTTTVLAATATANKILLSGASAAPVWSTPTFPNASATSGKIIQSDGTNWIASTATFPTAATNKKDIIGNGTNYVESTPTVPFDASPGAGKILAGDGTNFVLSTPTFPYSASATSGKIIKSDGTNWVASTETYATPGTSGNVLTSDGTNWTSAAPAGGGFSVQDYPLISGNQSGITTYMTSNSAGTLFVASCWSGSNTTVYRLSKDATTGDYSVTHKDGTLSGVCPTGMAVKGTTLFVNTNSGLEGFSTTDLSSPTAWSFSGTARHNTMFSDGTNLFIYNGTTDQFDKFTLSGTTATNAGAVTYTTSGVSNGSLNGNNGAISDGNNVWITDGLGTGTVNIRKYALTGGAASSTTTREIQSNVYLQSSPPSLFLGASNMLGIGWGYSVTKLSTTAVNGASIHLFAIALP